MPNCLSYAIGKGISPAVHNALKANRSWRNYILNAYPISGAYTKPNVDSAVESHCDNDEVGKALFTIMTDSDYDLNISNSQSTDVIQTPEGQALSIINTIRNTGRDDDNLPFQFTTWNGYANNTQFPDVSGNRIIFMGAYAGERPGSNHYFTNFTPDRTRQWFGRPSQLDTTPSAVNLTAYRQICQQTSDLNPDRDVTIIGWFS